ncbi:MAG TPA: cytochrome c-type biogenesis protein [Nitrospiria bacterium]|nr:cytochrome c-type biogenesis protein [Nitrospiria bacterium]
MRRKALAIMMIVFASGFSPLLLADSSTRAEVVDEQTIDIRTREIAKTLRCTVCQTESIWESGAELAREMRAVIRERVAQGESDDEIRAYFLSRYGDYILLEPRKRGLNWLIWAGPFLLLAGGGIVLLRTINRWVAQTPSLSSSEESAPLDEHSRQRIDKELRSLER